jgi:hypothetical protein
MQEKEGVLVLPSRLSVMLTLLLALCVPFTRTSGQPFTPLRAVFAASSNAYSTPAFYQQVVQMYKSVQTSQYQMSLLVTRVLGPGGFAEARQCQPILKQAAQMLVASSRLLPQAGDQTKPLGDAAALMVSYWHDVQQTCASNVAAKGRSYSVSVWGEADIYADAVGADLTAARPGAPPPAIQRPWKKPVGPITGIATYVGSWSAHTVKLNVTRDGDVRLEVRTYKPCAAHVPAPCDNMSGAGLAPYWGIQVHARVFGVGVSDASAEILFSTVPRTTGQVLVLQQLPERVLIVLGPSQLDDLYVCNDVYFMQPQHNYAAQNCGA